MLHGKSISSGVLCRGHHIDNSSMLTSVKDKMSMKYGPHLYLCTRNYDNDVKVIEEITPVHAPEKAKKKVVTPHRRQRISRLGHSMFAQDRPVVDPRTWANRNRTTKTT